MVSGRSSRRPRTAQGAASNYKDLPPDQAERRLREALGRSRGGLTSKLHLAADQRCRPVAFLTSGGQRHDSIAFETVLGLATEFVPSQNLLSIRETGLLRLNSWTLLSF